jgi:hypothetical protein
MHNEPVLQEWWRQVEETLREIADAEASKLRRLLADGIARMKQERSRGREEQKGAGASSSRFPGYLANPLRVLGLRWPCRIEEVKSAFRARAKQTHPDLGGRAEDFRAASDAYQELVKALAG